MKDDNKQTRDLTWDYICYLESVLQQLMEEVRDNTKHRGWAGKGSRARANEALRLSNKEVRI